MTLPRWDEDISPASSISAAKELHFLLYDVILIVVRTYVFNVFSFQRSLSVVVRLQVIMGNCLGSPSRRDSMFTVEDQG